MSKAILVIEIGNKKPENLVIGYVVQDIYNPLDIVACGVQEQSLKTIPLKKELEETGNSLIDDCKEYYKDGWNDCLDEIIGETE